MGDEVQDVNYCM